MVRGNVSVKPILLLFVVSTLFASSCVVPCFAYGSASSEPRMSEAGQVIKPLWSLPGERYYFEGILSPYGEPGDRVIHDNIEIIECAVFYIEIEYYPCGYLVVGLWCYEWNCVYTAKLVQGGADWVTLHVYDVPPPLHFGIFLLNFQEAEVDYYCYYEYHYIGR